MTAATMVAVLCGYAAIAAFLTRAEFGVWGIIVTTLITAELDGRTAENRAFVVVRPPPEVSLYHRFGNCC